MTGITKTAGPQRLKALTLTERRFIQHISWGSLKAAHPFRLPPEIPPRKAQPVPEGRCLPADASTLQR